MFCVCVWSLNGLVLTDTRIDMTAQGEVRELCQRRHPKRMSRNESATGLPRLNNDCCKRIRICISFLVCLSSTNGRMGGWVLHVTRLANCCRSLLGGRAGCGIPSLSGRLLKHQEAGNLFMSKVRGVLWKRC